MGAKAHNQHSPNQFIYIVGITKSTIKIISALILKKRLLSPIYDKTIPSLVFFLHLLSNLGIKAYC